MTEGDLIKWADKTARAVAHSHTPRCTGGTGYSNGGDSTRWHSQKCDALAADILNAMRSTMHQMRAVVAPEHEDAR